MGFILEILTMKLNTICNYNEVEIFVEGNNNTFSSFQISYNENGIGIQGSSNNIIGNYISGNNQGI
ncbi:hypothetical protein ALNOE001_07260 [Candidatus Methanobinarius endosymbioticus]|uniref:Uncharacterized protein n=1 Tax=Candidatus Methanobinarius endosymbioticus TaxID=2006182 RepID=A0A366MBR1_9EURY|nr:hypothetical protein ALNOE001_07260 [Candidatus Methanobinarius endosymbioticus]